MKSTGRAEKPRSTGHHSIEQTVVRELTGMAMVSTRPMWVHLTKLPLSPSQKTELITDPKQEEADETDYWERSKSPQKKGQDAS